VFSETAAMQIELHFGSVRIPELQRVNVRSAGGELLHSAVRGQYLSADAQYSFVWTAGVHALALLLLKAAVEQSASSPELPRLWGERGSPATALDYALSKNPAWIADICGRGKSGRALLSDLIGVRNPNGKRPGPVEVFLKPGVSVQVFTGSAEKAESEIIERLQNMLESRWQPYGSRRLKHKVWQPAPRPQEQSGGHFVPVFRAIMERELSSVLSDVNIYSATACIEKLRSLSGDPQFRRVMGKGPIALAESTLNLPASLRCGGWHEQLICRRLNEGPPLRVAAGVCNVGTLAVFSHLQAKSGALIELDASFAHALEVATRVLAGDPDVDHDLLAIASAPAASLLAARKRHEYEPLMFLPGVSQRVVRPKRASRRISRQGVVSLLHEQPSTASFYYEQLRTRGLLSTSRSCRLQQEPWESFAALASGESEISSVLFFPYADLNVEFNNCEFVFQDRSHRGAADVILFAHRSLLDDKPRLRALCSGIRASWADLLENPAERRETVERFIAAPNYLLNIRRVAGMHQRVPNCIR
jgi:hypothetical protein